VTATVRVGIDVRYLSHGLVGGVHTYVTRLVPALFEVAATEQFVLYADAKAPLEIVPPPGVQVRTLPWRHAMSSVWNDETIGRRMAADGIDVAFFPANHGFGPRHGATVITLHDALNLLPLRHSLWVTGHRTTMRSRVTTIYLHQATVRAVRRATRLVASSAYTRGTIAEACARQVSDIDVVHLGAPPTLPVTADHGRAVAAAHGIVTPYLLADGLKNPGVILRAMERLPLDRRRALTPVFFARHAEVLPVLATAAAAGHARLLVRPSAETLAALYAGAAAFLYPSWVEGFGIPLLEAMRYETPIIASNRGSIPEVAGPAAVYVDADDDAGLAAAIERLMADPHEAARLRAAGRARVTEFTWQRTARETLASLRRALAHVRGTR
jgi:glycosyltransferase involved in cell wall biosynthesis